MTKYSRRDRMMQRLLQAFRDFGYSQLTMGGLAHACDLSPRALYNHFKGKEDAFRETIRWNSSREIHRSWEAAELRLTDGGSALDAIVAILDARFGEARRHLDLSPHASELNLETTRRCRDILEESAIEFQTGFAVVLADIEKHGLIRLHPKQSAIDAAQLLTDGARGVNQTLPTIPSSNLVDRYRRMSDAVMYGISEQPTLQSRQMPPRWDTTAEPSERSRSASPRSESKAAGNCR